MKVKINNPVFEIPEDHFRKIMESVQPMKKPKKNAKPKHRTKSS